MHWLRSISTCQFMAYNTPCRHDNYITFPKADGDYSLHLPLAQDGRLSWQLSQTDPQPSASSPWTCLFGRHWSSALNPLVQYQLCQELSSVFLIAREAAMDYSVFPLRNGHILHEIPIPLETPLRDQRNSFLSQFYSAVKASAAIWSHTLIIFGYENNDSSLISNYALCHPISPTTESDSWSIQC